MSKYNVSFDWWGAVLEINDDEKTLDNMKNQLLFFMNGQDLIEHANGDIIQAYLKQIAPNLIRESTDWNRDGVISQFSDTMYEGFLPIDGSFGVKLISIDSWEFSNDDFDIKKIR